MTDYSIKLDDVLNAKGVKNNEKLKAELNQLDKNNDRLLIGAELSSAKELLNSKLNAKNFNSIMAMATEAPSIGDVVEKNKATEEETVEEKGETLVDNRSTKNEMTNKDAELILNAAQKCVYIDYLPGALENLYKKGEISDIAYNMAKELDTDSLIAKAKKIHNEAVKENYKNARKDFAKEIKEEKYGDSIKRKDIRKGVYSKIKEQNNGKLEYAYRQETRKEDTKIANERVANVKNVEFRTIQTQEQVDKRVKDKKHIDIDTLVNKGLVTKNEDNTYDFTVLRDAIQTELGKGDLEVSRDHKDRKQESELFQIKVAIGKAIGVKASELTDNETKMLVRACGFSVEGKNWAKIVLNTLLGAAGGAAVAGGAAGFAAYTNPEQTVTILGDRIENNINLTLDGMIANIDDSLIPAGASVNLQEVAGQLVVTINQVIQQPDKFFQASKFVVPTALKAALPGAIAGALTSFLASLPDKPEVPVCTIDLQNKGIKTYADYCKEVDLGQTKENEKYAPALKTLALLYTDKDGNFDLESYQALLHEYAGEHGTPLNKKELLGLLADMEAGKIVLPVKVEDNNEEEPVHKAIVTHETPQEEKEEKTPYDNTFIHKRKGGDSWKGIVEAYYPELAAQGLYGKDGAIKKLQRALCTKDGVFDKNLFNELIQKTDLPKEILLPSEVDGVKRKDGKVIAVKIKKPEGDDYKYSDMDRVGNEEKGTRITKMTINGQTIYKATDVEDPSQSTTDISEKGAISKLEDMTGYNYKEENIERR